MMAAAPTVNPRVIVVTSAAVAALVSALAALVGQYLDRRGARRHLLLEKSIELAKLQTEQAWRAAQAGRTVYLADSVILAETYYRWLSHLLDHDELPEEAKQKHEESRARVTGARSARTHNRGAAD